MNDVAIIGVGLHPFGRFGTKSAIEMAADAIQLALEDSGVAWKDIQFGIGGSYEVDNTDSVTRLVGLTGIPFTNVFNACATSASAIEQTADGIRSASTTSASPSAPTSTRAAPSPPIRRCSAYRLVRRERPVRHHEVLRHEGQPVRHRPQHLPRDPRPGGPEELSQRRPEPEGLPPYRVQHRGDPRVAHAELPADRQDVLRSR